MASTGKGIFYPTVTDTVKPASRDLRQLAQTTDVAIDTARQQAVDEAKWDQGPRTAPLDLLTARPGPYHFPTWSSAGGITPALPEEAQGGGTVELFGSTAHRLARWSPVGITENPKPVWQNEYNVGLGEWYGWHRISKEEPPQLRTDLITIIGDSQSEAAVVGSWDEFAGPLIEQTFVNIARSGDDTVAIGIRAGWLQPLVTVVGGIIPSSGSVTLRTAENLTTRENRSLIGATVAGVPGAVEYTSGGDFTFTRTETGAPVVVSGSVRIISSYSTAAATILVWMGGNDFNGNFSGSASSIADHVVTGYQQAVEWGAEKGQTVVVAGVTNRLAAGPGTDGFAQVQDINRRLRENHPGQFLDVQGYYSQHAIYDAGLTPNVDDLEAMGQGAIPPQLFLADGVHLTSAAHEAMGAHRIAPWLVARGYATPVTAVPAPESIARPTTEQRLAALESKSEYSTGLRDVTSLVDSEWTNFASARLMRNGNQVSLWLVNFSKGEALTGTHLLLTLPPGFRAPETTWAKTYRNSDSRVITSGVVQVISPGASNDSVFFTYPTLDDQPATLPGTPA